LPHLGSRVWQPPSPGAIGIFRFVAVATGNEHGLFINGETVEPASGEHRDVQAARAAVDGPWGRTPPTERSRLLHALADAIQANRKELAEIESRNVGKAISSVKAEVAGSIENFR